VLQQIESHSFSSCGLRAITIPASVTILHNSCFELCESLESVVFETKSELLRIEAMAFASTAVTSFALPNSVSFIAGTALQGLLLESLTFLPTENHFHAYDFRIENIAHSLVVRYFGSLQAVVVPASIEVIGNSCFSGCRFLESIAFESMSRLQRIKGSGFENTGLTHIHLPKSVRILGRLCFWECKALKAVTFEPQSNLQRIGQSAFSYSGLEDILIPASVKVLRGNCFGDCQSLMSVRLEAGSELREGDVSAFGFSPIVRDPG
jgi:hypothetical protein